MRGFQVSPVKMKNVQGFKRLSRDKPGSVEGQNQNTPIHTQKK